MKPETACLVRASLFSASWIFLALAPAAFALGQSVPTSPATSSAAPRERALKIAREIMISARFCTMVTTSEGEAQARIVDPLEPDDRFSVYVATNPRSRKVSEMRTDPRVTMLYFDTKRLAYVTLVGRATRVEGVEKSWQYKKEWDGFFDRSRPESYTLFKIVPSRVEVVSASDGLPGDPATWRPEIVHLK